MPDDPRNDNESGGFDDWLSEAPSKASDPYAELSTGAPDEDAGDWQSFADGEHPEVEVNANADDDEAVVDPEEPAEPAAVAAPEPELEPEPDQEEPPEIEVEPVADLDTDDADVGDTGEQPTVDAEDESPEQGDQDDTGEIPVLEADNRDTDAPEHEELPTEPMVEFEAFDGGDDADTGELEIVTPDSFVETDSGDPGSTLMYDGGLEAEPEAAASGADEDESSDDDTYPVPIVAWSPESSDEEVANLDDFDPLEDTGEAVFVSGEIVGVGAGAAGFGDMWDQDSDESEPGGDTSEPEDDEFTLGADDLLLGATQDHIGLAAAIAAAENEDTEQVALVAEIPGLETSIVGFEDVVEAEGHRRVRARASGDLIARIVTGIILIIALGASLIWRPALVVFAIAVFVLGAGEFYTALVRTDRKPIAFFGFIGIIGASVGAFFWSAVAIPMAFVLATILLLLFYAVVPGKPDPMGNLALTTTVMVWAGLGSFAMLIARSDDYQVLILGVVVAVAAADIAAFFVGRSLGRTQFAPWVSPKKTVEGLVAGVVAAFGVGAMLHFFPPFELTSGLAIGAAAAFLTPIGDLAMSAAKRSLGLKDMGSVLPGHGGFLDRIDGLLFVIPVAWAVFIWAGLL